MTDLPAEWRLAASAFNWTPEVIRAERDAADIAVGIVADGVARTIEVEPGQLWRSFPHPADAEVDRLREAIGAAGGSVSIELPVLRPGARPAPVVHPQSP